MSENNNDGMIVKDGAQVKVGNLIVGPNGSIVETHTTSTSHAGQSSVSKDEVLARLMALERALAQHDAALPNAGEVRQAVQSVSVELKKDEPSRLTVIGVLNSIADAVKSVTGIATTTQALKEAINLLYGW